MSSLSSLPLNNNLTYRYISPKINQNFFSPILPLQIIKQSPNGNIQDLTLHNNIPITTNKKINIVQTINKKTLVLDLDETLVHSSMDPFPSGCHLTINIYVNGRQYKVYVLIRPFVEQFLSEMSKLYEIIIFTASLQEYAEPLLQSLDKNKVIKYILNRKHCLYYQGNYIKDLKVFNRDIKDLIIIDNNPISYMFNKENGIPIISWFDDPNDNELMKFIPLLKYLSKVNDVRDIINHIVDKKTEQLDFNIIDKMINNNIIKKNNIITNINNIANQNNNIHYIKKNIDMRKDNNQARKANIITNNNSININNANIIINNNDANNANANNNIKNSNNYININNGNIINNNFNDINLNNNTINANIIINNNNINHQNKTNNNNIPKIIPIMSRNNSNKKIGNNLNNKIYIKKNNHFINKNINYILNNNNINKNINHGNKINKNMNKNMNYLNNNKSIDNIFNNRTNNLVNKIIKDKENYNENNISNNLNNRTIDKPYGNTLNNFNILDKNNEINNNNILNKNNEIKMNNLNNNNNFNPEIDNNNTKEPKDRYKENKYSKNDKNKNNNKLNLDMSLMPTPTPTPTPNDKIKNLYFSNSSNNFYTNKNPNLNNNNQLLKNISNNNANILRYNFTSNNIFNNNKNKTPIKNNQPINNIPNNNNIIHQNFSSNNIFNNKKNNKNKTPAKKIVIPTTTTNNNNILYNYQNKLSLTDEKETDSPLDSNPMNPHGLCINKGSAYTPNVDGNKKIQIYKINEKSGKINSMGDPNFNYYQQYINNNNNVLKKYNELSNTYDDDNYSLLLTQRNPVLNRINQDDNFNVEKKVNRPRAKVTKLKMNNINNITNNENVIMSYDNCEISSDVEDRRRYNKICKIEVSKSPKKRKKSKNRVVIKKNNGTEKKSKKKDKIFTNNELFDRDKYLRENFAIDN